MLRRTVLVAVLAALLGAPAAEAAPDVTNIAHRGASYDAPENTLVAMRLGARMRADLVEIDVQRSKDGHLVLMHDTTLARTTDVEQLFPTRAPWKIADFTLAEIKRLDAGSWKNPKFAGERVPTLPEFLRALAPHRVGLLLEAKAPELYPGIEREIARQITAWPSWRGRVQVQSFNWPWIRTFRGLAPRAVLGVLGTPKVEELAEIARYSDQVNPPHASATGEYIAAVHRHGMKANVWTVDSADLMRTLISREVDGIITNRPDVLRAL
ncbi:glycerophosphodiester phosphodiesterase [Allokutzneria sp. A3M-2-11 16]|uniref:glycerophosphodiester phosphodiesterase n=1 Tax=Allokutzneria sp. A3M-2-11 16 TaxID=2962043 RepID=UPI0020B72BC9|nr:glycerophosphodiester phosphodiesterase family protein [Allokutzneria sp. A3M-2-11 16]MCP3802305.1 glycerophosphodiester phosphodiesterase [Allokutzneria sp. A3M-2-11 16]